MTTYFPVDFPTQFYVLNTSDYANHVIKCYEEGTTTPISISTDSTGSTLVSSVALNASGLPEVSGNVIIPHVAENYKLVMYPTQAAADANTGAVWTIDNIKLGSVAADGALTDIASASSINLNSTDTNYFNITGTTGISTISLNEGSQVWVKFAGTLTITDGASLILLGGENITTAAGDIAVFRGESSNVVRMLSYERAAGGLVNAIGSVGGGTQDIDLTLGRTVTATIDTSTTTFTFSNPFSGADAFDVYLTNGGSQTINWPASVDWAGGAAPTLTSSGVDHLVFTTPDGGTTWYGYVAGLDMS